MESQWVYKLYFRVGPMPSNRWTIQNELNCNVTIFFSLILLCFQIFKKSSGHVWGLCQYLRPCWCLVFMLPLGPYRLGWPMLPPKAAVSRSHYSQGLCWCPWLLLPSKALWLLGVWAPGAMMESRDLVAAKPIGIWKACIVTCIVTKLLLAVLSGSLVLLRLRSALMSIACVTTGIHVNHVLNHVLFLGPW